MGALEILMPALNSSPHLGRVLSLLRATVANMSAAVLSSQLSVVTPVLFEAIAHHDPDVRKTTVLCLVDMYAVLGEKLTPHLSENLSRSQLKLVGIYIKKNKEGE